MSETVRKRIPVEKRSPYFGIWLQEMAERGLILKSVGFFRCEFEKCRPQKRRYRVLDKSYFSMSDDEKGIYEDAGWKYVPGEIGGAAIFTAEDEDAPELFSDRESYRKSVRNKWIGSIVMILIYTYWMARIIKNATDLFGGEYASKYGRLHNYDGEPLYLLAVITVLTVIITAVFIYYVWNEIFIIRFYTKNDMPDYHIPYDDKGYQWEKKANSLWAAATIIIMAGLIVGWIGMKTNDYSLADGLDALEWRGEHPVMLRDVDPKTWAEAKPMIEEYYADNSDDTLSIDYMVGKDSGACFSKGYREQLSIDLITGEGEAEIKEFPSTGVDFEDIDKYVPPLLTSTRCFYFSAYYMARSESIAEEYLGEEAAYDLYGKVEKDAWSKALEKVRIECDGTDYAGYYTTQDTDAERYHECQHLLLRKGRIIQIISYQGPLDIRDKILLFVNEMIE